MSYRYKYTASGDLKDAVSNFASTFRDCTNLTGVGWSGIITNALAQPSPPTSTDNCFLNCTSLTDYTNIPETWK